MTMTQLKPTFLHSLVMLRLSIWYDLRYDRYGVSGFPTLKFFPKGNKAGEDYEGGRDLDDFVNFINEKAGTSRDSKGQLTSQVNVNHSIL